MGLVMLWNKTKFVLTIKWDTNLWWHKSENLQIEFFSSDFGKKLLHLRNIFQYIVTRECHIKITSEILYRRKNYRKLSLTVLYARYNFFRIHNSCNHIKYLSYTIFKGFRQLPLHYRTDVIIKSWKSMFNMSLIFTLNNASNTSSYA